MLYKQGAAAIFALLAKANTYLLTTIPCLAALSKPAQLAISAFFMIP